MTDDAKDPPALGPTFDKWRTDRYAEGRARVQRPIEAVAVLWSALDVRPDESIRAACLRAYHERGEHMAAACEILALPHDAPTDHQWEAVMRAAQLVERARRGEPIAPYDRGTRQWGSFGWSDDRMVFAHYARDLARLPCIYCAGPVELVLDTHSIDHLLEAGTVQFELRCKRRCQDQSQKRTQTT